MRDNIDLETDELLPVNAICKARIGRRVSPTTLWRWRLKGVNGAKLECVRVGAQWCTTQAAFSRFLRDQQAVQSQPEAPSERDEATTRRLQAAGLL